MQGVECQPVDEIEQILDDEIVAQPIQPLAEPINSHDADAERQEPFVVPDSQPNLPSPDVTPIVRREVRILYVFAGASRHADVGHWLREMASEQDFKLTLEEVDILRPGGAGTNDVLDKQVWRGYVDKIRNGLFQALVMTPPCNTHSRARYANLRGPRPLRSKQWPWGFPWLEGRNLASCELGNSLVRLTYEACHLAFEMGMGFLTEHPEDLGSTVDGQQPGSIWAVQETFDLASKTGAETVAFFQCPFGATSSKPTRMLGTVPFVDPKVLKLSRGWPRFSSLGKYLGPLPPRCGHPKHKQLVGRDESGEFATSAAAAYPPLMCHWIAYMLVRFCLLRPALRLGVLPVLRISSSKGVDGDEEEDFGSSSSGSGSSMGESLVDGDITSDEEEPGIPRNLLKDFPGGKGPPLRTSWGSKSKEMNDGGGLCSPGRFHPLLRKGYSWPGFPGLNSGLRAALLKHIPKVDVLCFKLATGRVLENPFSEALLDECREVWISSILPWGGNMSKEVLTSVPDFQPFLLPALGETLRLLDDPDWRIFHVSIDSFSKGVPVGMGEKMTRTPAVYERKVKWRKYDESEQILDMENYRSAVGIGEVLQKQFEEESNLGMMYETTLVQAQSDYPGDRLRVAANGALEKSDHSWRILHDATHGVRVNPGIKPRDQQRMPTAGDARKVMSLSARECPGVHFSLHADVSKAHRRYLHAKRDWGLQACRANLDLSRLWINRTGTFGVGCASYWWSRLASGLHRLSLAFVEQRWLWLLLFADDLRLQAFGGRKYEDLVMILLVWTLTGTPFSWHKSRGGLALDWVGYWLDYGSFELGISESRAGWIIQWGEKILSDGVVLIRQLAQGLGRLGFVAGVLEWYKPFLGPLYSWTSAAPGGAVLPLPFLIRIVLGFIIREFKTGRRTVSCKDPGLDIGLAFKSDSKAEQDFVCIGGWECRGGTTTKRARWFSVRLTITEAPWLFTRGHGSRTVASSELLGTLLCVHLFLPAETACSGNALVQRAGHTDNSGNSFIIKKMMTTKMPVCAILMELAAMLSSRSLWLNLGWVPRGDNQEADDLTNEDFTRFDLANRVPVVWADVPFKIMSAVLADGVTFERDMQKQKYDKKQLLLEGSRRKRFKVRQQKEPWEARFQ